MLNNQFKSVFTKEDLDAMSETPVSSTPPINDIVICSNGVFKLLSEVNPFKSLGPDAVSGHVLNGYGSPTSNNQPIQSKPT